MNTREVGRKTENLFINKFIDLGFDVSEPVIPIRYDLIINKDKDYLRIQVKTGRLKDRNTGTKRVEFDLKSSNKSRKRLYTSDEIDNFAVYCADLGTYYLVPVGLQKGSTANLYLEEPRRRRKNTLYAADYEIKAA